MNGMRDLIKGFRVTPGPFHRVRTQQAGTAVNQEEGLLQNTIMRIPSSWTFQPQEP